MCPVKYIINKLSIMAGKKFATAYQKDHLSAESDGWKSIYIGLRRLLPIVGNQGVNGPVHWGNHKGSSGKPWKATQGF